MCIRWGMWGVLNVHLGALPLRIGCVERQAVVQVCPIDA